MGGGERRRRNTTKSQKVEGEKKIVRASKRKMTEKRGVFGVVFLLKCGRKMKMIGIQTKMAAVSRTAKHIKMKQRFGENRKKENTNTGKENGWVKGRHKLYRSKW